MSEIIWIICLFWVICGVISYGLDFAYFQRKYPSLAEQDYKRDIRMCIFFAIFGPINLIEIILMRNDYLYGLKFK